MFLLCKLFSVAIHSVDYFRYVMRLYPDEWKLTLLCPNRLGHYIIYFHSTSKSFVNFAILATYQSEKLHSVYVFAS